VKAGPWVITYPWKKNAESRPGRSVASLTFLKNQYPQSPFCEFPSDGEAAYSPTNDCDIVNHFNFSPVDFLGATGDMAL